MTLRTTGKLYRALVLVIVLTLAFPWAAFADSISVDGDTLTTSNDIAISPECSSYPVTVNGLITVSYTGTSKNDKHYTAGENLTVTSAVTNADGVTSAVSQGQGTLKIPSSWTEGSSFSIKIATTISKNVSNKDAKVAYTVKGDASGLSKSGEFKVSSSCVNTVKETSLAVNEANGVYNGTTTLSAKLTASGSDVSGKTISFGINGTSKGTATTDSLGVATLSGVSLSGLNAGSHTVSASFAGDASYKASSGSNTLIVHKADQTITFRP